MECAKALKVNVGTDPNADLGPVITKEVCVQKNLFSFPLVTVPMVCTCRSFFFFASLFL